MLDGIVLGVIGTAVYNMYKKIKDKQKAEEIMKSYRKDKENLDKEFEKTTELMNELIEMMKERNLK